jgi:hypothetical protein
MDSPPDFDALESDAGRRRLVALLGEAELRSVQLAARVDRLEAELAELRAELVEYVDQNDDDDGPPAVSRPGSKRRT